MPRQLAVLFAPTWIPVSFLIIPVGGYNLLKKIESTAKKEETLSRAAYSNDHPEGLC